MKAYFRVYALMFAVDVALIALISWLATIPFSSLWMFGPLAALMFSIAAFTTYKLQLRGVWWLIASLLICDVFIMVQFFVLTEGKMSIMEIFREIHQGRITFFITLMPEIVAHIVSLFVWWRMRKRI